MVVITNGHVSAAQLMPMSSYGVACSRNLLPPGRPPTGWPGDLAAPEVLSASDAKDASDLAGALDEYVVRCLFSKNWQLREAALQYIERQLSGDVSLSPLPASALLRDSPKETILLPIPPMRGITSPLLAALP